MGDFKERKFKELEGKTITACDLIEDDQTLCVAFSDGSEYQIFGDIHHRVRLHLTAQESGTLVHMPALISQKFDIARSEARRLLATDGVRLDGQIFTQLDAEGVSIDGKELQIGKFRRATVSLATLKENTNG